MSYVAELLYAEAKGQWIGTNQIRFATEQEAKDYLADIAARRGDVLETRVIWHDSKPNRSWHGGLCKLDKPYKKKLTFRS